MKEDDIKIIICYLVISDAFYWLAKSHVKLPTNNISPWHMMTIPASLILLIKYITCGTGMDLGTFHESFHQTVFPKGGEIVKGTALRGSKYPGHMLDLLQEVQDKVDITGKIEIVVVVIIFV